MLTFPFFFLYFVVIWGLGAFIFVFLLKFEKVRKLLEVKNAEDAIIASCVWFLTPAFLFVKFLFVFVKRVTKLT